MTLCKQDIVSCNLARMTSARAKSKKGYYKKQCINISILPQGQLHITTERQCYHGSSLDCWSTGRAIDPAPGAWYITKFIPLAKVVPGPVYPYNAESL